MSRLVDEDIELDAALQQHVFACWWFPCGVTWVPVPEQ